MRLLKLISFIAVSFTLASVLYDLLAIPFAAVYLGCLAISLAGIYLGCLGIGSLFQKNGRIDGSPKLSDQKSHKRQRTVTWKSPLVNEGELAPSSQSEQDEIGASSFHRDPELKQPTRSASQ